MMDILVVDDERAILELLGTALRARGHRVSTAPDGVEALKAMADHSFDALICDVRMPRVDGLALLEHTQQHAPGTRVILMTAWGSVADAVAALQGGAVDYLRKPFQVEELLGRLEGLAGEQTVQQALEGNPEEVAELELIGKSRAMRQVRAMLQKYGPSDETVLINGETGTGKELLAAALHRLSRRHAGPLVAVNCAGIPDTLLEAELFGHERGAFTGALRKRDGRFKAADKGSLLLDEVGELSLPAQAKLLRVLQERQFEPLGSDQPVSVDVRVISATHRNLREMVAQGAFRQDLYYRLKILELEIPPLRNRIEDLPWLVAHFLKRFGGPDGPKGITAGALRAMGQHTWPGNVRELEHAIRHAVAVCGAQQQIDVAHLPADLFEAGAVLRPEDAGPQSLSVAVREFEREYLERALKAAGGSKTRAAQALGISRKSLWEKLRRHTLAAEDSEENDLP